MASGPLRILVLHGPNLNRLGRRQPELYGTMALAKIDAALQARAAQHGAELTALQSDAEHELIAAIHRAADDGLDYLIFNPAAFTHTSIALRDALLAGAPPFVEVHLSNIAGREAYRRVSYFSDIALGVISGFGAHGYLLALDALFYHAEQQRHGSA